MSEASRPQTPAKDPPSRPKSAFRRLLWFILFGILATLISVVAGYSAGLSQRRSLQTAEIAQRLQEQFDLGVEDFQSGRFELAQQRFEYVLSVDPGYPGAEELLAETLKALDVPTATPSLTPVPATPTPTFDVSSLDGLLEAGQAAVLGEDWTGALEVLLALKAQDPAYRASEVDDLMYSALRNRGLQLILQGHHERGIYDFSLAERIRPLDSQAESWRRSAAFYLVANSYFGLDWAQAVNLFSQICGAAIWDSCFKYARSTHKFGDELIKANDPCEAIVYYGASLKTRDNPGLGPTATEAAIACLTATAPTPSSTPTPTAGTVTPFITQTPTPPATLPGPMPTPSDTAVPVDTPTPTFSPTPTFTPMPTSPPAETPTPTFTFTPSPT